MHPKKRRFVLPYILLILSACSVTPSDETNPSGEQMETVEMTQQSENAVRQDRLGESYYNFVLDADGNYAISQSRGITTRLNSDININLFEKDLLRLSQEQFPTDQYYIQEGQKLVDGNERSLAEYWLRRQEPEDTDEEADSEESEEQANNLYEGLNPPESGEGDNRNPRYLNSILELDFYEQTEEGVQLAGMSIGLAMNTVDYYPREEGGPTISQEIASETVLEQGQAMANEIVARVRQIEGLGNIPIVIGVYEQPELDDLAGGTYVALGLSGNGSNGIDSWNSVNEERLIFPLEGSSSAEGNAFANFQSEVETFFPNLSGITGRAHYIDERLEQLTIEVMTQFYGETEMISFTQYLKQSATTYLPQDIKVEIIVESPSGVESFLKKDLTDADYFSYVFD